MAGDLDKINAIFRAHDEKAAEKKTQEEAEKASPKEPEKKKRGKAAPVRAVDKLLLDETGQEASNYTGDATSERDYRPVRQSHEYRSGCLGGLMYAVFLICVSVVLA